MLFSMSVFNLLSFLLLSVCLCISHLVVLYGASKVHKNVNICKVAHRQIQSSSKCLQQNLWKSTAQLLCFLIKQQNKNKQVRSNTTTPDICSALLPRTKTNLIYMTVDCFVSDKTHSAHFL